MNYKELEKVESKFNVIYPTNDNATYHSILNYSNDINRPYQRWYRYKEGYSVDLVKKLIVECKLRKIKNILDPFMGSGTTLLAARELGINGYGFEVNPFSYFLANCKLAKYTDKDIKKFYNAYNELLSISKFDEEYILPLLSISNKVFTKEIEKRIMNYLIYINKYKDDINVYNLLKLGIISVVEEMSNYRKAGNGLKIRRGAKFKHKNPIDLQASLLNAFENMYNDVYNNKIYTNYNIFNESCINMVDYISKNKIDEIIFSPPYANCFDYTEIYKLELWFGGFVNDYSDLKSLRKKSLHSHLNSDLNQENIITSDFLQKTLKELNGKRLWDKRIPKMLELYYGDMFNVINQCYKVLRKNGYCNIIIGNSAYSGIVFPSDLLFADYASYIGFEIISVEIDRFIVPSSQQYNSLKKSKKFLRESIVCLKKK